MIACPHFCVVEGRSRAGGGDFRNKQDEAILRTGLEKFPELLKAR